MNPLAFCLFVVGVSAAAIAFVVAAWGLLDGYEARRDSRRRNGAHRL